MADPSAQSQGEGAGCAVLPLKRHCLYTLIQHRRFLGDLGDIDGTSVRDIMKHCSPEEMAAIEDSTREGVSERDLSWYTWHLWHQHYVTEMGTPSPDMEILPLVTDPPGDYTPPVTFAPEGDWRSMMEMRKQELEEKAARLSGRLRSLYQAEQQLRDSRKVEVCQIKAPVRRRREGGGAGPGGRGAGAQTSISGSSSKGKMLKGIGLVSSKARSIKVAPPVNHKARASLWKAHSAGGASGSGAGQRQGGGAAAPRPAAPRPAAPALPLRGAGAAAFLPIPPVGAAVPPARGAGASASGPPGPGAGAVSPAATTGGAAAGASRGTAPGQARQFTVAPVGFHPSPNLPKKKPAAVAGGGATGSGRPAGAAGAGPGKGAPAPSGYSLGLFQKPAGFRPGEAAAGAAGPSGSRRPDGPGGGQAGGGGSAVGLKRPAPSSPPAGSSGAGPHARFLDSRRSAGSAPPPPGDRGVKRSKLSTGLTDSRRAMMEDAAAAGPPQGRAEQMRLKQQVAESTRRKAEAGRVLRPMGPEDY